MTHQPCDTDLLHETDTDCTDARVPTAAQADVIDLLGLNPDGRRLVRLTLATWRTVDRVVARLGIPTPRTGGEG